MSTTAAEQANQQMVDRLQLSSGGLLAETKHNSGCP